MAYSRDMTTTDKNTNQPHLCPTDADGFVDASGHCSVHGYQHTYEADWVERELQRKRPPYNHVVSLSGEVSSMVPGWQVIYPARVNGHLADVGFVSSLGMGGSDFVHFNADGEPYGTHLTQMARQRLIDLRRDFKFERKH